MRQFTPITNECTPEKKEEFQSLNRERNSLSRELISLKCGLGPDGTTKEYWKQHDAICEKIRILRDKCNDILNGKPGKY